MSTGGGIGGASRAAVPALSLSPVAEAALAARRYVKDVLTQLGCEALVDWGELGVSELVTNACLHARTPCVVQVTLTAGGGPRISVSDQSTVMPMLRRHGAMSTTGRGLRLLEVVGRWGADSRADGKTVWFEPSVEVPEDAFAQLWDEELSGEGL